MAGIRPGARRWPPTSPLLLATPSGYDYDVGPAVRRACLWPKADSENCYWSVPDKGLVDRAPGVLTGPVGAVAPFAPLPPPAPPCAASPSGVPAMAAVATPCGSRRLCRCSQLRRATRCALPIQLLWLGFDPGCSSYLAHEDFGKDEDNPEKTRTSCPHDYSLWRDGVRRFPQRKSQGRQSCEKHDRECAIASSFQHPFLYRHIFANRL